MRHPGRIAGALALLAVLALGLGSYALAAALAGPVVDAGAGLSTARRGGFVITDLRGIYGPAWSLSIVEPQRGAARPDRPPLSWAPGLPAFAPSGTRAIVRYRDAHTDDASILGVPLYQVDRRLNVGLGPGAVTALGSYVYNATTSGGWELIDRRAGAEAGGSTVAQVGAQAAPTAATAVLLRDGQTARLTVRWISGAPSKPVTAAGGTTLLGERVVR